MIISQLKENRKKKIVDNLEDYDFGLYVPPKINKRYIYLAEGPIWEGAAIDPKKTKTIFNSKSYPLNHEGIFKIIMAS